jgi:predicted enzyme related to lactoylglutathione lyase
MDNTTNALNWFEIPTEDLARAQKFYERIFDIQMFPMDMGDLKMAGFPGEPGNGKVSGALVKHVEAQPSMQGAMIYLNANPAMDNVVARIEEAGGKILMPKTQITEDIGYMAVFADTEGNRMALHSIG